MDRYKNPGLLFNKHYFRDLDFLNLDCESNEEKIKDRSKVLYNSVIEKSDIPELSDNLETFKLTTIYPGLFSGSGYAHEATIKGELKLGFYFDYTSGLPCIPGSSVKGVLRNAFKKGGQNYIVGILKDLAVNNLENIKINELENRIFGNEKEDNESAYKRDVFFDAFPITTNKKILGSDTLAPHKDNPLKNPDPLNFMKVLPETEFIFRFKLTDDTETGVTAEQKKELFKEILLDFGIGAKTNVGYGQFVSNEIKLLDISTIDKDSELICEIIEIIYRDNDDKYQVYLKPPIKDYESFLLNPKKPEKKSPYPSIRILDIDYDKIKDLKNIVCTVKEKKKDNRITLHYEFKII